MNNLRGEAGKNDHSDYKHEHEAISIQKWEGFTISIERFASLTRRQPSVSPENLGAATLAWLLKS